MAPNFTYLEWLNYHTLMLNMLLFDQQPRRKLSDLNHIGLLVHFMTCFPLAQEPVDQLVIRSARRRLTRQTDRKLDGAVKVSSVMIDVIPEPEQHPGTGSCTAL